MISAQSVSSSPSTDLETNILNLKFGSFAKIRQFSSVGNIKVNIRHSFTYLLLLIVLGTSIKRTQV